MHDLAVVATIQKIEPIEGKDRIVLATVENYKSIIAKDDFKVGDKVIYVFYDAILPVREEFEFLRKRCFSEKWQGFRIKPMKMGGVISEGLVLSMSLLDKDYPVGTVVTDKLGIRRYDPEALEEGNTYRTNKKRNPIIKWLMKFKWFRKLFKKWFNHSEYRGYPTNVPKSDETNIEKCYDYIKTVAEPFIVTEKVEGQAGMYYYKAKGNKLNVYSHNFLMNGGNWQKVAVIYNIKDKLRKYCKNHNLKEIAISGEIIGESIQKNIYNRKSLELYLYNAYYEDGRRFNWDELTSLAKEIDIPTVPYIDTVKISDFADVDAILEYANGNSTLYDCPREGYVFRTFNSMTSFKAKSRPYKIWFGN